MISRISIVMLGVRDLARSIAFYRDQVGLIVQREMPGFAYLSAGAVTLCLSEPLAKAKEPIVGATEVVFAAEHVRAEFVELRAKGVEFVNEPRVVVGSSWAANFVDPDGHLLSVFGPE
jgi:catechol 2,3-dioxygenase-like lactoylglutathione lyase family enzyme